MARVAKMEGMPTEDGEVIRQVADAYLSLADELDTKRASTKVTTSGKTAWRKTCVEKSVDPVVLARAADMVRQIGADPEKVTREWNLLIGYLKALGFYDKLVPGLFDDFEITMAEDSASAAA
ncbi:MAG: hypothetical protein ACR2RE_18245 [Geminicoccaceae bacterium]